MSDRSIMSKETNTYVKRILTNTCVALIHNARRIPLKMLHPRNPPNPETQIPQYNFKFKRKNI